MSAHDTPEYSTASGNDYPAHEQTYRTFTYLVLVSIVTVVSICLGLAVGGVKGNWWFGGLLILAAIIAAAISLPTNAKLPAYVVLVIGLLGIAFA
jgi:hypothetical protein